MAMYDRTGEQGRWHREEVRMIADQMLETLRHRGPDERNQVVMGKALLGHTRLSIIDLNTGSQPMLNETGRVGVVFNGEIYNFQELRADLKQKGHHFKTQTDTEVVVHLYEEEGEDLFSFLNGMFAFVIYDSENDILLAARDRVGEKPLLYYDSDRELVLASELKAFLKYPTIPLDIDRDALALYLSLMYVPAPHTIYKSIRKLPPAHYLKMRNGSIEIRKYWHPVTRYDSGFKMQEFAENFDVLFSDAVRRRMIADVPLGVFLSGGIDSSAVTAYMARNSDRPIETFTVGFADEIDERPYARMVAERYQTRHREIFAHDRLEDVFERVYGYFDEPFGDSSAIPTYMVSKEAREHVKVILTGDGGDELFLGYPTYLNQRYQRKTRAGSAFVKYWHRGQRYLFGSERIPIRAPKEASERAKRHWISTRTIFPDEEIRRLLGKAEWGYQAHYLEDRWLEFSEKDSLAFASEYDINFYLPDDLLKKVDMASMLSSLECRAPFLDHRLIEMAMSIPQEEKIFGDDLKHLLKIALKKHLPPEILGRKKIGFGAPVESWQKNQLRSLVLDLLAPNCRLAKIMDYRMVEETKKLFYENKEDGDYRLPYKLWLLFVLEKWMRVYGI